MTTRIESNKLTALFRGGDIVVGLTRNCVADLCFAGASILTDPVLIAHRTLSEVTINTGFWRVVPLVQCLFFSSIALFTALPGLVLRVAGSTVQPYPFSSHLYASAKVLDKSRFTLLSWNVAGLDSGHTYTCAGLIPFTQRIHAVAQSIIKTEADVVCLYEMMDWKTSRVMMQLLKDAGYKDFYYNIGPNKAVGSGLFVASKLQTTDPQFTPFNTAVGRTKGANKGVFSFGIKNGSSQMATIVMTHPQHSEETSYPVKEELDVRAKQLQVVFNKMKESKGCVIVTGDLNARDHELKKGGFLHAMTPGSYPNKPTWEGDDFSASLTGQKASLPACIDWTLVKKGTGSLYTTLIPTGFDPKQLLPSALSDHKGLLTRVSCKPPLLWRFSLFRSQY